MAGNLCGLLAYPVLRSVINELCRALSPFIINQVKPHCTFRRDLTIMKMTLESVEAVIQDAERRSSEDASVLLWLKRLKEVMHDVSDMLNKYKDDTEPTGWKSSINVIPRVTMAYKMKSMRRKLQEITNQNKSFTLMTMPTFMKLEVADPRETSSDVGEALIIGRSKEKEKIKAYLSERMEQKVTVLPIYGMGGIGKTTLAKLIFNDAQFKVYSQVWVYVSQSYEIYKIGNSIISQLSGKESQLTGRQMIFSCLRKLFDHKKLLIVLDDLWECDSSQLATLKDMLILGEGSHIIAIVTTRNEAIAEKVCTIEPYMIQPLDTEMCWELIKQKSNFESRDDKGDLEDIGRNIAMKCGGIALAAQTLGYMLQTMTYDEWVSVHKSHIWNEFLSGDASSPLHVLASLKLSYSTMHPYLKLCFANCAVFPKGQRIRKDDLMHQWISLGFIEPSDILSTNQLSEKYFKQLLGFSFLQQSESPLISGEYLKDITYFTMHDLVHDLARSVMVDEFLDASKEGNSRESTYRYALLTDHGKELEFFTDYPAKIRAIRFVGCEIEEGGNTFSSSKFLRVLDFRECSITTLPDYISQLKYLRYLNAPRVQGQMIPNSITKLSKLIYLNLHGSCELLALPELIGEMQGLIHLDISGCSRLQKLPESLGKLKGLLHLDLSGCHDVTGVSGILGNLTTLQYLNLSQCLNLGELPRALGNLMELQYLNLFDSSYLQGRPEGEVLCTLTKLEYLNLSSRSSDLKMLPEALGSFTKLKYLNLSGCGWIEELPRSFGNLKSLVHLDLSYCFRVQNISKSLGYLTKLQFLNLRHCCFINDAQLHLRGIGFMGNLKELRYLNLSNCLQGPNENQICNFIECISTLSNLEHLDLSENISLCSVPESFGCLKKLHTLDLTHCALLDELPKSLGEIDSLKIIIVKNCSLHQLNFNNNAALLPYFVVQAGDDESSSSLLLLQDANPNELVISRLGNVKSAKEAQAIKLMDKTWIEKLKFEWTKDTNRFVEDIEVLEELVPPSSLKKFDIQGYNSVGFPAWLMGITSFLPCLVTVIFMDMPKCNSLPPFGQLPRLQELVIGGMDSITKIDEGLYGGERAFLQLKEFVLDCMEGLEEWITVSSYGKDSANELMFPNLERLTIQDCPKLRMKPHPPKAHDWTIWNSDNVISSWEENVQHTVGSSSSSQVTKLMVRSCKVPLHQWRLLHHLSDLTALSIEYCSDLTSSAEIIQELSGLQSLSLEDIDQPELPTWLGEITSLQVLLIFGYQQLEAPLEKMKKLTSLYSVESCHCKSMSTLPQWLGELTSLQELHITKWPELNGWQSMRHLTSLQKLVVNYCDSIQALPEWLGDLASLKEIFITDCDGIESLPDSMNKLTKLEELRIYHCPKLSQWCGLEENRMKLAHIKEKGFY